MPVSFPTSPSNGDTFTSGGRSWTYSAASNSWIGGLSMAIGTLAAQNSNAVVITGGSIAGITSLATGTLSATTAAVQTLTLSNALSVSNGGTGGTTAGAALTNLGAVPNSRTINGRSLTSDVLLDANDLGFDSSDLRGYLIHESLWSELQMRRLLNGTSGQYGGGSNDANANGSLRAFVGTTADAISYASYESGMSLQPGQGAVWTIPERFAVAGAFNTLLDDYEYACNGVTLGSNTFTIPFPVPTSALIGNSVFSSAFPANTRVTNVSGTTVTVNNNAISSMANGHIIRFAYDGLVRVALGLQNSVHSSLPECPSVTKFGSALAQNPSPVAGSTTLDVYPSITATAGWNTGNTFITLTAADTGIGANQTVSGVGIPAGALVASISGTRINLKDSTGAPLAVGTTVISQTVGFGFSSLPSQYVYGKGIAPGTTIVSIANRTDSILVRLTLSQPIAESFTSVPIGYGLATTENFRANNGIGFDFARDPADGKIKVRLYAMRAGLMTFGSFVELPGIFWNVWYQFILDYADDASSPGVGLIRLWIAPQSTNYLPPVRPANTLTSLAITNLGTRASGGGMGIQAHASGIVAPPNTSTCSIGIRGMTYYPDVTATPVALAGAPRVAEAISEAGGLPSPLDSDNLAAVQNSTGALKRLSFADLWAWIKSKVEGTALTFTGHLLATAQATGTQDNSLMTRALGDLRYGCQLIATASSDLTKTSDSTIADDSTLALTLPAGRWHVEMMLLGTLNFASHIRHTGSSVTGSTGFSCIGRATNGSVSKTSSWYVNNTATGNATGDGGAFFSFVHIHNAESTLTPRWAQHTSSSTPSTRYAGSFIRATYLGPF